ncbi:unnamed protein product [Closterium sp. NIES-65]|nr:unnamed protein product [Closterium sp. NIES-65]
MPPHSLAPHSLTFRTPPTSHALLRVYSPPSTLSSHPPSPQRPLSPRRRFSSFPTPSPLLFLHAVAFPLSPHRCLSSFPHAVASPLSPRRRLSSFPHAVASPLSPRRRLSSFPTPSPLLFPHAVASPLSPTPSPLLFPPRRRFSSFPTPSPLLFPHAVASPLSPTPSPLLFPPRRRLSSFPTSSPLLPLLPSPLPTRANAFVPPPTRHIPIEQASSPSIIFFTSLSEAISTSRFLYSSTLLLTIVHPSHHCIPPCGAMEGGAAAAAAAPASSTTFSLPRFYDYPPYFTLQPIKATRERQVRLWAELIVAWCRHHRTLLVSLDHFPLFHHPAIQRKLTFEARQVFLEALVAEGRAEWTDRSRTRCLILWKSINDWADTLLQFVRENGFGDSVLTLEEIRAGDDTKGTDLEGIDEDVLRRAIRVLEGRGLATLFKGSSSDDEGVKFFA